MSKDECEYFYNQIRMNHYFALLKRAKSLEATMFYPCLTRLRQKNPKKKKINGWKNHSENKRECKKEKPKDAQPARTKERRELIPFVVGSYLTHKSLYYHLHANHQI